MFRFDLNTISWNYFKNVFIYINYIHSYCWIFTIQLAVSSVIYLVISLWWATLLGFEILKTSLGSTLWLKRTALWGLVLQCGLSVLFVAVVAPCLWFWSISSMLATWPGSSLQIWFSLWWECLCTFLIWGRGGLPTWCSGKEPESAYRHRGCRFSSLIGKIPWRKKWQSTPVFFAWKILLTEEPGGLYSMGSQRDRHNWAHTHMHAGLIIANHRKDSCYSGVILIDWCESSFED